jgi:hypothetical protein
LGFAAEMTAEAWDFLELQGALEPLAASRCTASHIVSLGLIWDFADACAQQPDPRG